MGLPFVGGKKRKEGVRILIACLVLFLFKLILNIINFIKINFKVK